MQHRTIILTELWEADRSTFIRNLCRCTGRYTESESDQEIPLPCPTAFGFPIMVDLYLMILTTGSGMVMPFLIERYFPEVIGFIVMVDSTQPDLSTAAMMIERYAGYGAPRISILVAANKQDAPEARSIDDLRVALNLPDTIPIVPCIATDLQSVKQVFLTAVENRLSPDEYQAACTNLGVVI
ncbi:MAG: hypothetical protein J0M07_20760 [Anaerolineae bacterium]|nr:hypothetical protein [Anaerolineae bacterium]